MQRVRIVVGQRNLLEAPQRAGKKVFFFRRAQLQKFPPQVHQKIRNFHCDQCPYSAFFKHTLEKHVVKHIPDEFRARFVCDCCDFVSISAVNIVLHKKYEHSQSRQLSVCEHKNCGKEFSRPGQLTAHIRLTHEKRKDKMCGSCSRSFSTSKFMLEMFN